MPGKAEGIPILLRILEDGARINETNSKIIRYSFNRMRLTRRISQGSFSSFPCIVFPSSELDNNSDNKTRINGISRTNNYSKPSRISGIFRTNETSRINNHNRPSRTNGISRINRIFNNNNNNKEIGSFNSNSNSKEIGSFNSNNKYLFCGVFFWKTQYSGHQTTKCHPSMASRQATSYSSTKRWKYACKKYEFHFLSESDEVVFQIGSGTPLRDSGRGGLGVFVFRCWKSVDPIFESSCWEIS